MSNPLLSTAILTSFSVIDSSHVEPALREAIDTHRKALETCLSNPTPTVENFLQPLLKADATLHRVWGTINHLNGVIDSPELRKAYEASLPLITQYHNQLGQNTALYQAYLSLSQTSGLNAQEQKLIEDALLDFKLSGVALPEEKKQQFQTLSQKLSQLSQQFSRNVLDATDHWQYHITDPSLLSGLPESARALLKGYAQEAGLEGWLITLHAPSYIAIMTHAENRELREQCYRAYQTRASEMADTPEWDNSSIMVEILECRDRLAKLLEFEHYAQYSLATKMCEDERTTLQFLDELALKAKPYAEQEKQALEALAQADGVTLSAWDVAYYSEKLRERDYQLSEETLRAYFPLPHVLSGLFDIVHRLFGIHIQEIPSPDVWHSDVRFFEVQDAQRQQIAYFYLDLFSRKQKRGGAWMDDACSRAQWPGEPLICPQTFLVCNFAPASPGKPALLTHEEVLTLFHEFGHGLHHMLTQIDYPPIAGINGVPWDAVELPSQLLENWCWEKEGLALIAKHYESGERLPTPLQEQLMRVRRFQAGLRLLRQVEFARFDFSLHCQSAPFSATGIQSTLNETREKVSVMPPPDYQRFQHSFSHIFAGGYAAGYYSYKWAEVLAADVFSRFEKEGILNADTGLSLLNTILSQGGLKEPMDMCKDFLGREPSVDALLAQEGLHSGA